MNATYIVFEVYRIGGQDYPCIYATFCEFSTRDYNPPLTMEAPNLSHQTTAKEINH